MPVLLWPLQQRYPMLRINFDESNAILLLEPGMPLTSEDFDSTLRIIDNHLALRGKLTGIIVKTGDFSCWQTFEGFIRDLRLFKNHHQKIKHVALVTDAIVNELARSFAEHFSNAKVRQFRFDEEEHARNWMLNDIDYE